jgi:CRISPR-associated endonuclease/helicase Cas3
VPDNQWEPPETYVAWREEVQLIDSEELLAQYPPNELLEDYPLKPQELLRDRTSRVFEALEAIVERLGKTLLNAWILRPDADVEVVSLTKLVRRDKQRQPDYDLGGCIVILPRSAGGLRGGSLDGESETADDVADQWFDKDDVPLRKRVWNDEKLPIEMKRARLVRELNLSADTEQENDDETAQRLWRWYVRPHFADDDGSRLAEKSVALCDHCQEVECKAEAIAKALGLNDELVLAAKLAGRYHDLGKSRPLWQRTIKNYKEPLLAKSGTRHPPAIRTPYRHEFGSLLDLEKDKEFQSLDQDLQDFVLHLVAVHHGRGRPHFPDDEVFDPRGSDEACQKLALEIPLRFVRLQRKFGRWGLCYLESILRAADAEASARPIKTVEESQ